MKTPLKEFQKLAIENYQKENQTKDKELTGFIQMLRYYCVETRTTEIEVLKDDVLYQRVYHLFDKHKDFKLLRLLTLRRRNEIYKLSGVEANITFLKEIIKFPYSMSIFKNLDRNLRILRDVSKNNKMSNGLSNSSVGRKVLMALSGFFLLFFLMQHFVINLFSVVSADLFNEVSHFMGTNGLIQFVMQPVLLVGSLFPFAMGMY